MNRTQILIIGVLCSVAAYVSLVIGSGYSGLWFMLLAVLYPASLAGTYLLYLFRTKAENVKGEANLRGDVPYLVAIAAPFALLLITLVVLGS